MLVGSYQAAMGLMEHNGAAEKMSARKRQRGKNKQQVSLRQKSAKERKTGGEDMVGQK